MADLFSFRHDERRVPGEASGRSATSETERYLSPKGEVKGERQ